MTNNIENYQPNVPKEIRKRYKKAKMRNFIGYLVCQWVHHSNYRSLNNGWFFIPSDKMVKETGLSKHTILNYESQLILEGMIEKKSGNFTDRKANEYRCTFMETAPIENCTETKTSTQKTAPINCTQDSVENEKLNEKTAPIENEENCTTDTVTVPETDIYKCLYKSNSNLNNSNVMKTEQLSTVSDCHQEESKGLDNVTSLRSVTDSLQSSLGSSDLRETEHSSEVKDAEVNRLTTVTGEAPSMEEGFKHFFTSTYGRGYNEKLIANFSKADDQYAFLWEKWNTFLKKFPDSDISFGTAEDNIKTFLWMLGKIYKTPSKLKERKAVMVHNFKSLFKHFFLIRWKAFLKEVDVLTAQDCKKTRLAFYDKVVSVYEDDEEREKTLSQMEVEYAIAYQATDKWSNPKPEELDPDLMYQNLSDGEVEETEVFSETQVTGETDGDTSNRVYDKWYGVWRKLLKEVSNSNGKLTIDEHTTVAIMEKAEADELPYGWRQKLKEAMEEDLEQFNRKEDIAD